MTLWLHRRLHISWLIMWCCLGTLGGLVIASFAKTYALSSALLLLSIACWLTALVVRSRLVVLLIIVSGCIFGMWRGGIEQVGLQQYRAFYGKNVVIQGTVSDDASTGTSGDERLTLKDVMINDTSMNGYVWVSSDTGTRAQRSDHIIASGKLGVGFGSVAASMFHAKITRLVRPNPGDIGLHIRDWFASGIRIAIPEPEASLASGYLVGQRSTLPADLDAQLKIVGLTHAVVASGYNLTILVSLTRQLLAGASKYLASISAVGMVAGFIAISGASPSMTRAGLVTSLTLATWYYGRNIHPLVLLSLAAAVTALFNPFYVWDDIGWYLSFTSFAGVIVVAPLVQRLLWRGKEKPGVVMQTIVDTMSAQLATLPIMLLAFGHYSPYALIANLLVLPLVPLTMLLTFIAGIAGLVLPAIAHIVGWPADCILRYMAWVTAHMAELPGAQGELAISIAVALACYALLAFGVFILVRILRYDFRKATESEEF